MTRARRNHARTLLELPMMSDRREGAGSFSRQRMRHGEWYCPVATEASTNQVALISADQRCLDRMTLPEQNISLESPVLDSLANGVSVCDEDGFLLYTNPAEDRLFGYARGERLSDTPRLSFTLLP